MAFSTLTKSTKEAAIAELLEAVLGELKQGAPRKLAELLFSLLESAVRGDAALSKTTYLTRRLARASAASQLHLNLESGTFKGAVIRFEQALRACRPDDPALFPKELDRDGVACIDPIVDGQLCLLIVRGPTSTARGEERDNLLRLAAEFRTVRPLFHWNLQQSRNRMFTGREPYFEALNNPSLSDYHPRIDVLVGLGGVGKSHLCLEYAFRHRDDFDVIWWVRASDRVSSAADITGLGRALALADETTSQPEAIARTLAWLETRDRWLLIFDNAHSPSALSGFLPQGSGGRTLITSLNPDWDTIGTVHEMYEFTDEEAALFLKRRSGRADRAYDLAETLGHLPLALEHAAAYMRMATIDVSEYLQLYESHRAKLLRSHDSHLSPIVITWSITIEIVQAENTLAAELLKMAAFLAHAAIPRIVFRDAAQLLRDGPYESSEFDRDGTDLDADTALALLRRYSLINALGKEVSIHRLLQDVVRENMQPQASLTYETWALATITTTFARERYHYYDSLVAAAVLPHARVVTMPQHLRSDDLSLHLLHHLAAFFLAQGSFAATIETVEEARQRVVPDTEPLTNLGLCSVAANAYRREARLQDATREIERGLALVGDIQPQSSQAVETLVEFLNIAAVIEGDDYHDRELALQLLDRASNLLRDQSVRPEVISTTLANIGATLRYVDELDASRRYLDLVIEFDRQFLGDKHPLLSAHLSSLGITYIAEKNYAAAEMALREALQMAVDVHGAPHRDSIGHAMRLVWFLTDMGDYNASLAVCEEALAAAVAARYPEAVITLRTERAFALAKLRRHDEAEAEIEQALQLGINTKQVESLVEVVKEKRDLIKTLRDSSNSD